MNVKRVGVGTPERRPAGFTESPGIVLGFAGAEARQAEVRRLLLVLIGGVLSPGGGAVKRSAVPVTSAPDFPSKYTRGEARGW